MKNMTNKGTVKWFNKSGYGFIEQENGDDVFVHYSNIVKKADNEFATLEAGETVKFEIEQSPKGFIAKNIVRV